MRKQVPPRRFSGPIHVLIGLVCCTVGGMAISIFADYARERPVAGPMTEDSSATWGSMLTGFSESQLVIPTNPIKTTSHVLLRASAELYTYERMPHQ